MVSVLMLCPLVLVQPICLGNFFSVAGFFVA
jgi:hypothetical protein